MSSTPLTDNALSRPAGLVVSLRLLAAIVIFAAIAPGILMTAPAVAAQLASEWQLKPGQIGWLFSAELGAMSLATLPAWRYSLSISASAQCGPLSAPSAARRG